MFDISFMEILVISIVALIVIGPERLPTVARTLGHLYGRCRGFVYSVKTDIHNEMRMEELKKMQSSVQDTVESVENSIRQGIDQLETTITTDAKNNENSSANLSTPHSHTEPRQPLDAEKSLHDVPNQEKK